jgi:hypothetical protein
LSTCIVRPSFQSSRSSIITVKNIIEKIVRLFFQSSRRLGAQWIRKACNVRNK